MLTDDMEHVIKLPSKGLTDNDLKHIDQRKLHQILVLSRVLDHFKELQQKQIGASGIFADDYICTCTKYPTEL